MADRNALLSLFREAGLDDEAQDMIAWWGNAYARATGSQASSDPRLGDRRNGAVLPPGDQRSLVQDFSRPIPPRMQIGPNGERMPMAASLTAYARPGAPETGIGAGDASAAMMRYARTPQLAHDPVTAARIADIGVGQGVAPGRPAPNAWPVPPEPASFPQAPQPQRTFFRLRPQEGQRYMAGGPFGQPVTPMQYAEDVAAYRAPASVMRRVNLPGFLSQPEEAPQWRRLKDPFAR